MSIFESDIWRIGIVKTPVQNIVSSSSLKEYEICWLPEEPPYRFLADPFGIWKGNRLYLFAESYDYRIRKGRIEGFVFDEHLHLQERRPVLEESWHLSYPMIIEDQEEIYIMPESYKSGETTLYHAVEFPWKWERVKDFTFPEMAIDPTLFYYQDHWWMFYTPVQAGLSRQGALCIAWAKNLTGPWHLHPKNPVRVTPESSRPGGNVILTDQGIILPTQNCSYTYGGSLVFLQITTLTHQDFEAHITGELRPNDVCKRYNQGIHTLSSIDKYSLIDAKQILHNPFRRLAIDGIYRFKKRLDLF